jgi:hypothetical protein
MKKVVFIFMLALGSAWTCRAQTWTFLQDGVITSCNAGASTCQMGGNNVLPTTAGSVMIVRIHTQNNITITSVSGGGGTWQLCPASSCHVFDSAFSDNQDLAYNLSGTGGASTIQVTVSSGASGFFGGNFMEFLPPAGATPSFDAAGTASSSTCTTCTGVGLTLSATDLVVQVLSGTGASGANAWHAFSSPYVTDYASNGINLNATSGTAPTLTLPRAGADFSAIAFKTSLGSYTPPTLVMSVVHYTQVLGANCAPSCTLTIPATGTGNLLYVESSDLSSTFISSISGAGTQWVVPTGSNTCRLSVTGGSLSCAYELASVSGATALSVTMTGGASTNFAIWEIASTAGAFSFDAQGSANRGGSPNVNAAGVALALNGTNDVIFQSAFIPGGTNAVTLYPQPENASSCAAIACVGGNASNVALLNSTNGTAPLWINGGNNTAIGVTGVAFHTGTGAAAPAPPTGLAAVVH